MHFCQGSHAEIQIFAFGCKDELKKKSLSVVLRLNIVVYRDELRHIENGF